MSRPLVSLCVPTWNRAASLAQSLKSIVGQRYEPLEIIISDNGSTDGTEPLCRELAANDARVRYYRQDRNIGLYGNHNFCIDQARGDFLGFFHDHDERSLDIVSRYVDFFEAHPEVGVVCSDWYLLDNQGRRIGVRDYKVPQVMDGLAFIEHTIARGRSSVGTPGALVRTAALGPLRLDETKPIGFGDFLVWFQIAERWSVGHISERLWDWTQDQQSQSARTIESLTHDYLVNMNFYCDGHVQRFPEHAPRVAEWRRRIDRFIFWALLFEVGLHFRHRANAAAGKDPTLFEILDYRLTAEQFRSALAQLEQYRRGPVQTLSLSVVRLMIRLGLTQPLTWATKHYASIGALLGLR